MSLFIEHCEWLKLSLFVAVVSLGVSFDPVRLEHADDVDELELVDDVDEPLPMNILLFVNFDWLVVFGVVVCLFSLRTSRRPSRTSVILCDEVSVLLLLLDSSVWFEQLEGLLLANESNEVLANISLMFFGIPASVDKSEIDSLVDNAMFMSILASVYFMNVVKFLLKSEYDDERACVDEASSGSCTCLCI